MTYNPAFLAAALYKTYRTPDDKPGRYRDNSGTYNSIVWLSEGVVPPTEAEVDFEINRVIKRRQLDAKFRVVEGLGAPYNFGTELEPLNETLQIRDQDKANWLTFRQLCSEMFAMGYGEAPAPLPIRTTANNNYTVTANKGLEVTAAIRAYAAFILSTYWGFKDAIATVTSQEELDAIDINAGW